MNYSGDVTCNQCWEALVSQENAQLIDVRSVAEWNSAGVPDVSSLGRDTILVEWQQFPDMQVNKNFQDIVSKELEERGASEDTTLFFICQSGVRSRYAAEAMSAIGFKAAYNVMCGYRGGGSEQGAVTGWKPENLPWRAN